MTVPRCFMIWWHFWSNLEPTQFPMPTIISDLFPHYTPDDDDSKIRDLLVNFDEQTEIGDYVEQAWELIDDTDRLLMLVCWAARQEVRPIHNTFAHPTISRVDATSIITNDLTGGHGSHDGPGVTDTTRMNLLARALVLIPRTFY